MVNYEEELNPEQIQVVMAEDGPILVIAGAGSGKTRTITYRVARLIESGVSPDRILLATFTNKAAREMLGRVDMLTGIDINRLWGGTFHHIGNLILRRNCRLLGYESNYSIMDSEDSRQLINACTSELGFNKIEKFPKGNVVRDVISLSGNTEDSIDQIIAGRYPYFHSHIGEIVEVASRYRIRKKELNMMDFDDLLFNLRELLVGNPAVLSEYSERFLHVLVDEYQDTNVIQAEILDLLASRHRNLMVVGDDSQSIYSFRGANFANIIRFPERYPDARIFKLETNYRSTPEILNLANMSIINNEKQFQKELRAVRPGGIRPILVPAGQVIQQANFVTQRILELIAEGIPLNEIAVLYRAHYHSMELQMELTRRGIPFEIRSGIRFFEQAHIKDVTSFMKIMVNPFDELAWKRLLMLYRNVGKVAANRIWKFVSAHTDPLSMVASDDFLKCASKTAAPGLLKFRETIENIIDSSGEKSPLEIIDIVLEGGYREYLQEKYTDIESREEDLNQLGNFSGKFDSLENFLSELALLTNIAAEEDRIYRAERDEDRVILSTIHQAKGLEWLAVFMIWCSDGMIPLARALKDPDGEEEERRLFYVAATRARDQLYFCYPMFNYARGMGNTVLSPSRFIEELAPCSLGAAERPYDQWVVNDVSNSWG
ncbi:MAG: ATP-dependent helicase [Proteobacteria bacterium]|nr:ATP-dependent helicase [Pseudomonadota bacterium]